MSTATPRAVEVTPMNDRPFTYPTSGMQGLGEDALNLLRRGRDWQVDCDPFERPRFISREERDAYRPSERVKAAMDELAQAGLATLGGGTFNPIQVSEEYTVANGRGSLFMKVTLDGRDGPLLATLVGADIESKGANGYSRPPSWILRARHESATDFEHDASSTAWIEVLVPTSITPDMYGGMSFFGTLGEVRLYPLGTDPLQAEDRDTQQGGDELCNRCDEPHPFAPYMPPEVSMASRIVHVQAYPMRPYAIAANDLP